MSDETMIKNKLQRQLALYAFMRWTEYHNPYDVMVHFRYNNERAMQRDFKDLEDAGVIRRKYVKHMKDQNSWPGDETLDKNDNYEVTELMSDPIEDPKRKHLPQLNHLARVMHALPQTDFDELYDCQKDDDLPPDYPKGPAEPNLQDAVAAYRKAFPNATDEDRERDFQELNDLGFYVKFSERYQEYVIDIRFCSAERHFESSPRGVLLERLKL